MKDKIFDRLTKAETVALWHAVDWMKVCLREWKREHPDEVDSDTGRVEFERLEIAKRALRKVNELRKQGL